MIYFKWDSVVKIIKETPKTQGEYWRATLCCDKDGIYKIYRETISPFRIGVTRWEHILDVQRILNDKFYGYVFVDGYKDSIERVSKKETIKP